MKNTENPSECPSCGSAIPEDAPQGLCPQCVLSGAATQLDTSGGLSIDPTFPDREEVTKAFPQLEIIEVIGRGGMGVVYKARQPQLDRLVALKVLPKKLGADPQFAERFSREGKLLARLNHPTIVTVYDFGHVDELYYLVMEFVDGVNLREAMQEGRFSPKDALEIVPKICEALQYAHEQGILHRDIKPENILLDSKGQVKIADFGIAKLASDPQKLNPTLTSLGQTLGTPHYMAPEQIENPTEVDHRADIYSLGVVLYEMLTGELPIGRFDLPSTKTPVSQSIDQIVLRALEKDRERRQSSASKLKTEVEEADSSPSADPQSGTEEQAETPIPPRSTTKWSVKSIIAALLSAAGCVFLAISFVIVMVQDDSPLMGVFTVLPPGLLLGIVGSVIGWIGLSDIRHSHGKLMGLPLGVFGALALPIIALASIIVGVPTLMAIKATPPTQLSPFSWILLGSLALTLSLILIVMTFRWADGKRAWVPLTRAHKLSIAGVILLFILTVFPLERKSSLSQAIEPTKSQLDGPRIANAQNLKVNLRVLDIQLNEDTPHPQLIIGYEQIEQGAKLKWNRRGQFKNMPDGLSQSARIRAKQEGDYNQIYHTVALDLPNSFEASRRETLTSTLQSRWQDKDLTLYPGDLLRVLTIEQASGEEVILEIACESR